MPAPLTIYQHALANKTSWKPRQTVKFCNRCGGNHKGDCPLVTTSRGTLVRVDLLQQIEDRYREASRA